MLLHACALFYATISKNKKTNRSFDLPQHQSYIPHRRKETKAQGDFAMAETNTIQKHVVEETHPKKQHPGQRHFISRIQLKRAVSASPGLVARTASEGLVKTTTKRPKLGKTMERMDSTAAAPAEIVSDTCKCRQSI